MILRLLLMAIGIAGIIVFFLPMGKKGIVNVGNVVGLIVSVLILLFGTFSWLFSRNFKIVLLILVLIILILIILINSKMSRAKNKLAKNQTVVIVAGCTSKYYISDMLNDRIKAAARYLDKHEDAVCIACGGRGNEYYDSEAEYIETELKKYGVAKSRIFTDTTSTNTFENMRNAKRIIVEKDLSKSVAIATNEFHQYRAGRMAMRWGMIPSAINANTEKYLFPTYYVREILAIIVWQFRKK